jgi:hypothetical protein
MHRVNVTKMAALDKISSSVLAMAASALLRSYRSEKDI